MHPNLFPVSVLTKLASLKNSSIKQKRKFLMLPTSRQCIALSSSKKRSRTHGSVSTNSTIQKTSSAAFQQVSQNSIPCLQDFRNQTLLSLPHGHQWEKLPSLSTSPARQLYNTESPSVF